MVKLNVRLSYCLDTLKARSMFTIRTSDWRKTDGEPLKGVTQMVREEKKKLYLLFLTLQT